MIFTLNYLEIDKDFNLEKAKIEKQQLQQQKMNSRYGQNYR